MWTGAPTLAVLPPTCAWFWILDTVPTAGAADAGLFMTDEQIRSTTKHDRDGRVDIAVSFGKGINMLYAVFRLQAQKQG
jgi:hypothetical protein